MDDFYAKIRSDVVAQMDALEPAVQEYERLARILEAIDADADTPPAAARSRSHASGRRPEPQSKGRTARRRAGERRPSEPRGQRAREVMEVIRREPGLPIPEIAERLGIRPGYLYQLLPRLAEQGMAVERGKEWHPVAAGGDTGTTVPHAAAEESRS